jgi:hypothetical protein
MKRSLGVTGGEMQTAGGCESENQAGRSFIGALSQALSHVNFCPETQPPATTMGFA